MSEQFENHTYTFEGAIADNGMQFETVYRMISPEGSVSFENGEVRVEGATSLTLVHTAATDYLPQFPDYKGRDYQDLNRKTISSVEGMTKEQLLQEHQADYQALFNRVILHLGDANDSLLKKVLKPVSYQGYNMSDGGGSYANLLCAHPPFQLDGNMGSTAGVAEMLLQSHIGVIEVLSALPGAWPDGEVKGLRARGGYTVDISWEDGTLKEANIRAAKAGPCTIAYQGRTSSVEFQEGERKTISF